MAQQYIFQMQGLTKAYPGGKKVFENIWLSFYNDAKIGVVGVNGSGKSTLLKIMAGLDTEFQGEAKAADGVKRGYLEQEPQLDPALNVRENVEAWCEEKQWVNRFNAVAAEQRDGIAQVSEAVSSLDQMTQQNAALVEESAAASHSLNEQSQNMKSVVGRFKVPGAQDMLGISRAAHAPHSGGQPGPRPSPVAHAAGRRPEAMLELEG